LRFFWQDPEIKDFVLDDDFNNFLKENSIFLRSHTKAPAEVIIFQALFREIKKKEVLN